MGCVDVAVDEPGEDRRPVAGCHPDVDVHAGRHVRTLASTPSIRHDRASPSAAEECVFERTLRSKRVRPLSRLRGVCGTSTMDGPDFEPTSMTQDRVGCRCGECSVEVRSVQDVDASNHLA